MKTKLKSYSIESVNGSLAIWGNSDSQNLLFPLCYLRRPKYLSEESWDKIKNSIKLELPNDVVIQYG